jgi:hypothetical protein
VSCRLDGLRNRVDSAFDVSVCGLPARHRHTHAPSAAPGDAAKERLTGGKNLLDHAVGASVVI